MTGWRTTIAAAAGLLLVAGGCGVQHHAPAVPTAGDRPSGGVLPSAAEPQNAPAQHNSLPGPIVAVGQAPEGVVADATTRTVAVATRKPNQLVLIDADTVTVTDRTPLPGSVRHVELAAPGGPVLVPVESANALVRVGLPSGAVISQTTTGASPHDAVCAANGTIFVSNEAGGTVAVVRGDTVVKVFNTSQPAGLAAVGDTVGMLDVRANSLTTYDAATLKTLGSVTAGAGPTHLVADRHGRMIAADTRGNAIRVFAPLPTPRQIASVTQDGGPYGITYDAVRDRLWVASSGTNEVVGYDMTEPSPREIQRLSTVQNPYSIAVDSKTGRLFVAGVTAGVVQIADTTA